MNKRHFERITTLRAARNLAQNITSLQHTVASAAALNLLCKLACTETDVFSASALRAPCAASQISVYFKG